MMELQTWQWLIGFIAGLLIGISKTGIPGVGILVVGLLAAAFGGRASVGLMLPMLCIADLFAIAWYRQHAQWDHLRRLLPWVAAGLAVGALSMWVVGRSNSIKDVLGMIIGLLILMMLALHLLQRYRKKSLAPKSGTGLALTGIGAGFTTMVSNAAGPIMAIYMAAARFPKDHFMGTSAWLFFLLNLTKVPVYLILSWMQPWNPLITIHSLTINALLLPAIALGAFWGKWLLKHISQEWFDGLILVLAGLTALKLLIWFK